MECSLKIVLVAQCTCKAIENFARAPRDEVAFSDLQPGNLVISSMRRVQRYQIYRVVRKKVQTEICGAKIINYISFTFLKISVTKLVTLLSLFMGFTPQAFPPQAINLGS